MRVTRFLWQPDTVWWQMGAKQLCSSPINASTLLTILPTSMAPEKTSHTEKWVPHLLSFWMSLPMRVACSAYFKFLYFSFKICKSLKGLLVKRSHSQLQLLYMDSRRKTHPIDVIPLPAYFRNKRLILRLVSDRIQVMGASVVLPNAFSSKSHCNCFFDHRHIK